MGEMEILWNGMECVLFFFQINARGCLSFNAFCFFVCLHDAEVFRSLLGRMRDCTLSARALSPESDFLAIYFLQWVRAMHVLLAVCPCLPFFCCYVCIPKRFIDVYSK